jgi:hypothetical protein
MRTAQHSPLRWSPGSSGLWRVLVASAPLASARPNPSIERTPYGMLRMPAVAAHVER